jgi:L-cysteate sulfo-lyase
VGLAADALWVKRDDLSGLGGGGNKVRKLQYTCAGAGRWRDDGDYQRRAAK